MPVKSLGSPSKARLFRVFAPTTTKRTKLAAGLGLLAVVALLLHPATRRVVRADLAAHPADDPATDADADAAHAVPHRHRSGSTARRHGVDEGVDDAVDDDDADPAHDPAAHDAHVDAAAAEKWGVPGEQPVVLPGAPDNDLTNSGMKMDPDYARSVNAAPVRAAGAGDAADADAAVAGDDEGDDEGEVGVTGRTAKIVTCPGCRLNALPEVKKFVHELAKAFEPGLKIDFKIGEDPVLHLYDEGKKTEEIALDKFTSDKIIERLVKHGISPTTDIEEVNRVVEKIDSEKDE